MVDTYYGYFAPVQSPSCPSPMSTWLHQSDTRWTCCCLCKFGPLWDILKYDFHLSKQIPSLIHLIWCNRGTNPNQPRILFLIWKTFRYFNLTQTHKPCNQSTSGPSKSVPREVARPPVPSVEAVAAGDGVAGVSRWTGAGRHMVDHLTERYQHINTVTINTAAAAWCQHCSRWLTLQLAL